MQMSRLRRSIALVAAAAVFASLTAVTVASPASAAKPKCQGKTATIVGTRKGDIIRGTAGRDIIVARGGNDRIYAKGGNDIVCAGGGNDVVYGGLGADRLWGQLGHDKLNGNAGNDFLAGQVGNDRLVGGINYDTCFQGTGTGAVLSCERPAPPAPPTPPPDSDGDGIPDGSDACPNRGDEGYGVDATGCPNLPDMCLYLTKPSIATGTYAAHGPVTLRFKAGQAAQWKLAMGGTVTLEYDIEWDDGSPPLVGSGSANTLAFPPDRPGTADLTWKTYSGAAAVWDIGCSSPA